MRNISERPARYLVVSTMHFPDVAGQLDTGTVLAIKGPTDGWAFPADSAGDYMALTIEALQADPEIDHRESADRSPALSPARTGGPASAPRSAG